MSRDDRAAERTTDKPDNLFQALWIMLPPKARPVLVGVLSLGVVLMTLYSTGLLTGSDRDPSREGPEAGEPRTPVSRSYQLRIEGVELFPNDDRASVKVIAFVNGTEFIYPSIGGVEWLRVAPSMAGQTFRLPSSESYEVRFEMRVRREGQSEAAKLLSQETVVVREEGKEGRYGLHGFDPASGTRDGRVSAEVIYALGPAE